MIFVFAGLDATAGYGSFYDANLLREPSHFADEATVDGLLADSIRSDAARRTWLVRLDSRSGPIDIPVALVASTIRVSELGVSSDLPEWTISGEFAAATGARVGFSELFQTHVVVRGFSYVPLANGRHGPVTYTVVNNSGSGPIADRPPMSVLFPPAPNSGITSIAVGSLVIDQRLSTVMTRYFGALVGDPLSQSGVFWRMFYFSATTATTLGLGDITPLTPGARLLVTLEAIVGAVLFGLFLASLSVRRQPGER